MALYAISDLHLALNANKPMDIFGEKWLGHDEKIKSNWINKIKDEDTVLIAGDISWGMRQEDSKNDLEWISNLPGKKLLIRGNHDYWWNSISKLNKMFDNMKFIQNNFFVYNDWAICGSRGWICPGSDKFNEEKDKKIYDREQIRLRLSLDKAKSEGYHKIICMIHYPPTNEKFQESEFIKIFKEYEVQKVIYGHLHGSGYRVINGERDGVEYFLTSSDHLNFNPIKILD